MEATQLPVRCLKVCAVTVRLRLAIATDPSRFRSESAVSATQLLGGDDKPSRTDSESQAQAAQYSHTPEDASGGQSAIWESTRVSIVHRD